MLIEEAERGTSFLEDSGGDVFDERAHGGGLADLAEHYHFVEGHFNY